MSTYPPELLQSPLLANIGNKHRELVLSAARRRTVDKGEVLFHEGDAAEGFFILSAGCLKLVRYTMQGKEMLVHLVRPGESFAEAALFGPKTYPASAAAVEPSVVWLWPREQLLYLIKCTPELALALVVSVSVWTRHLVTKLELLTQRRVEERLAVYLTGRAGDRRLESGEELVLTEAKQLIAAQIGTAPEVLSRIFRRLEEAEILSVQGDRVCILDGNRFAMLAERIEVLCPHEKRVLHADTTVLLARFRFVPRRAAAANKPGEAEPGGMRISSRRGIWLAVRARGTPAGLAESRRRK